GELFAGIDHGENLQIMKHSVAKPKREKQNILEDAQRIKLAAGGVRPANVIKRAIRSHLGSEQVVRAVFGQSFHFARINGEGVNAERGEPGEITVTIATNTR